MTAPIGGFYSIDSIPAQTHKSICRTLPKPLLLACNQRPNRLVCHGLTLPDGLQWHIQDLTQRIFKRRPQPSNAGFGESQRLGEAPHQPQPLRAVLLEATASVLHMGMAFTGIALRLAKRIVDDMRKSIGIWRVRMQDTNAASELMQKAQAQLLEKARRETLREQGKDPEFMQMLHNLDRCHMDHEEKWALFRKHSADKAEFSERWQHLYKLAKESKAAVDTLLRPDASRSEINQFWRSAETSAIIAEENALKQLVFAQVFTAGQS